MSDPQIPELERILFFKGQLLAAGDLTSLQVVNRELRWLHNRSLHTWGIGIGLSVIGESGDTSVTVGTGYAVDCLGREIILSDPRTISVPVVAASTQFFLTAQYQADNAQKVLEKRDGVCVPEGTVRLGEEPLIEWKKSAQLDLGIDIVLARATVANCQLAEPLFLAVRRSARPSAQPYMGAGQTPAASTPWTLWVVGGSVQGLQVDVSTAAARFQSTPAYIAHVAGNHSLTAPPGPLIVVGYTSITGAAKDRFTLQFLLPKMSGNINPPQLYTSAPAIAAQLGLYVTWMGVEG